MSATRLAAVAVVIACAALALSIRAAVREPKAAPAAGGVCIDREARDEITRLRVALATRRSGGGGGGGAVDVGPAARPPGVAGVGDAAAEEPATPPAPTGPTHFARFESQNPAVTVTQQDDGLYVIRTSDPALSGSVVEVTAITAEGAEERLFVRVP